jgi:hypothetical protein
MKKVLTTGSALFALAVFATTADARMMGAMTMPSSMSRGDIHTPVTSSPGSPRTFSPDGHSFSGRTFSPDGLQQKVKGSNWKKPIDSDGGGPSDPPKKAPKNPTQTTDNGSGGNPYDPYQASWNWHHHHPYGGGYNGTGGNNNGSGGNVPQRDCRGC